MHIRSQKDFYSGLMFTAVGIAFSIGANNYSIGSAARMGPGYFPLMLGIVMILLGLVITFQAFERGGDAATEERIGRWAWRPLILILSANLLFGILLGGLPSLGLPSMGLAAAIFALTIVSCAAGDEFRWKEVLILAAILAVGSWFTFIQMLKLQYPVWPTFLS